MLEQVEMISEGKQSLEVYKVAIYDEIPELEVGEQDTCDIVEGEFGKPVDMGEYASREIVSQEHSNQVFASQESASQAPQALPSGNKRLFKQQENSLYSKKPFHKAPSVPTQPTSPRTPTQSPGTQPTYP